MPKRGNPSISRMIVVFLRFHAGMTQAELGKASRIDQSLISDYEQGRQAPSEEALRRIAKAVDVAWPRVVHLRRFCAAFLSEPAGQSRPEMDREARLRRAILEPALLSMLPYLLANDGKAAPEPSPEAALREAEEVSSALERFPVRKRRQLLEFSCRSSRSAALVEKVRDASARAAASQTGDARELEELAQFLAGAV